MALFYIIEVYFIDDVRL